MKRAVHRKAAKAILIVTLTVMVLTALVNIFMITSTSASIISVSQIRQYEDHDVIMVLGSRVNSDHQPAETLSLRLDKTAEAYQFISSSLIICSGDNRPERNYETDSMRAYLVEKGVDNQDIVVDEDGYRTYDSIKSLVSDFRNKHVILITQKYHLYRALYIAHRMGIDAIGIAAEDLGTNFLYRNVREYFARVKDFLLCIIGF